jgi:putative membrane protein
MIPVKPDTTEITAIGSVRFQPDRDRVAPGLRLPQCNLEEVQMLKALAIGTVALGLAAAPAYAQGQPPPPAGQTGTSGQAGTTGQTTRSDANKSAMKAGGGSDQMFVTKAAKGGLAEVQLGQLAADKASSDQVKQFGQRMVTDHSKANDELKSLAQQKNITLPTDVDAQDKATHDRLAKLSGAAFDRAYMQHMLADHRKDVNEFKRESTTGKDPEVKAWAGKTLPTLEEHLKLAQDTTKAVGTSGTKSGANAKSTKGTKGR